MTVLKSYDWDPSAVTLADLNGDARPDILFTSSWGHVWPTKVVWYAWNDARGVHDAPRIIADQVGDPRNAVAGDWDGDGDNDVAYVDFYSPTSYLVWHENLDGAGYFSPRKLILEANYMVDTLYAGDIDNDGYADLIYTQYSLYWIRNTVDGQWSSAPALLEAGATTMALVLDMNRDGNNDVLRTLGSDLRLYLNDAGDGSSWTMSTPYSGGTIDMMDAADVNGDLNVDVVIITYNDYGFSVLLSDGASPSPSLSLSETVSMPIHTGENIKLGDLDGDNVADVVVSTWIGNLYLFVNDGTGSFATPGAVQFGDEYQAYGLAVVDADGDGDDDVFVASKGGVTAFHSDGADPPVLSLSPVTVYVTEHSVRPADLNSDGSPDVLLATSGYLGWFAAVDGSAATGWSGLIHIADGSFIAAFALDLDSDGDLDIISGGPSAAITVYDNSDGAGTFAAGVTLATPASAPRSLHAMPDASHLVYVDTSGVWRVPRTGPTTFDPPVALATDVVGALAAAASGDVDGSGTLDVVAVSADELVWFSHTDGAGSFTGKQLVGSVDGGTWVTVDDVDGSGVDDVVVCAENDDTIVVYLGSTTDPLAASVSVYDGSGSSNAIKFVDVGDVDGDGDLDIVASFNTEKLVALFSQGPDGTFGARVTVNGVLGPPLVSVVTDMDGDGDMEVLALSGHEPRRVVVLQNLANDTMRPWLTRESVISRTGSSTIGSMFAEDLDNDGDIDLATANSNDDTFEVWLNTDGAGSMALSQTLVNLQSSGALAMAVTGADLDGDGDTDLLGVTPNDRSLRVWFNVDGAASFGPPVLVSTDLGTVRSLVVGDADGDGDMDVVTGADIPLTRVAKLLRNRGDGSFDPPVAIATCATGRVDALAFVDDGLVVGCYDGLIRFMRPPYDETAAHALDSNAVLSTVTALVAADFSGDGHTDVVATGAGGLGYMGNNGTGPFVPMVALGDPSSHYIGPSAGDVDGDGDIDCIAGAAYYIALFANHGGGGVMPFDAVVLIASGTSDLSSLSMTMVADLDGDLSAEFVFTRGVFTSEAFSMSQLRSGFSVPQPQIRAMDLSLASCIRSPTSFECVRDNIGRLSRCVTDTLLLEPGVYTCLRDSHFRVTWPMILAARLPGTVVFDCALAGEALGGVLFRVMASSNPLSSLVGALELRGIAIRGMGVARQSLTGAPGLRVEGVGASLALVDTTVQASASASVDTLLLDEGVGGAVLARDGGKLVLSGSHVSGSSASESGGCVAVSGSGSQLLAESSTLSGCTASGSGGGLAVLGGATALLTNVTIVGSTASTGSGGAVSVDASSRLVATNCLVAHNVAVLGLGGGIVVRSAANVTLANTTLASNVAVVGGGIAATPVSAESGVRVSTATDIAVGPTDPNSAALSLAGVAMRGNSASTYGGGMYACAAAVDAAAVDPTAWTDNVAGRGGALGSSASVMVCGGSTHAAVAFAEGVAVHGPPGSLVWDETPRSSIQVGDSIEGAMSCRDFLGSVVSYVNVIARVSYTAPAEVIAGDAATVRVDAAGISMPSTALFLRPEATGLDPLPSFGWTVSLVQSAEDGLAVGELTGTTKMTKCAAGAGAVNVVTQSGELAVTCAACAAGTYSLTSSFEACLVIRECPVNALDVSSPNTTVPECVCSTGFYLSDTTVEERQQVIVCSACPPGAVCKQGLGVPVPAPGFYTNNNASFVRCKRGAACPGGAARTCNRGYEGYMCNSCSAGHYSNSARECVACPDEPMSVLVGAIVVLGTLSLAAAAVIALGIVRSKQIYGRLRAAGMGEALDSVHLRSRVIPPSISMCVVAFQVVSLLSDTELSWPGTARDALSSFNALNVDVTLFASECSLESFHTKYVVSVMIPIAVVVLAVLGLTTIKLVAMAGCSCGGLAELRSTSFAAVIDAVTFTVAPLLYIPMSRSVLVLFDCSQLPDDTWVLDSDPGVTCFDQAWWSAAPFGVVALVSYVLGVPLYFLVSLRLHRHDLLEPQTFLRYGPLYKLYRVTFYWGGVADLAKRLAIVSIAVFVSEHQLVLIGGLLIVLGAWMVLVRSLDPFFFGLYNRLDFHLNALLLVVLLLGGAAYAERSSSTAPDTAITVLVITFIALLGIRSVVAVAADVLDMKRARASVDDIANARLKILVELLESHLPDMRPADANVLQDAIDVLAVASGSGKEAAVSMAVLDLCSDKDDGDDVVLSSPLSSSSSASVSSLSSSGSVTGL